MEDLITFVAVFSVMISIFLIVTSASLTTFYNVAGAEKELIKTMKESDVKLLVEENGVILPGDRVLYVNVNDGNVTLENRGTRDFFYVRLLCWDKNDPANTVGLVTGEQNGTEYNSVPVITTYSPYNEVNYAVGRGKVCVVVGRRFIKGFVVP